jgi:hypothetical protein
MRPWAWLAPPPTRHAPQTGGHPRTPLVAPAGPRCGGAEGALLRPSQHPHALTTTGDAPDAGLGDTPVFPHDLPTADCRRAEPNARGEPPRPRRYPRATKPPGRDRLQCRVRGCATPACAPAAGPDGTTVAPYLPRAAAERGGRSSAGITRRRPLAWPARSPNASLQLLPEATA